MRRLRVPSRLGALGLVVAIVAIASGCITNSGTFELSIERGSEMLIDGQNGEFTRFDHLGGDNTTTNSLSMVLDPAGAITVDPPTDLSITPSLVCPLTSNGQLWCLNVGLVGIGAPQTGQIDPNTGEFSVPLSANVTLEAVTGFDALDPGCTLGPITGTLHASYYDAATGTTTLTAEDIPLAATTTCGTNPDWNALLNGYFGLPGTVDLTIVGHLLDANGLPPQT